PVEEVLAAANDHSLDEILRRMREAVELAAPMARIDEGMEPDRGEEPGLARSDIAKEMRDDALRQVVGLDLVRHGERLQLRYEPPMPPDHATDEAFVPEM